MTNEEFDAFSVAAIVLVCVVTVKNQILGVVAGKKLQVTIGIIFELTMQRHHKTQ